jgi:hypothetical protein
VTTILLRVLAEYSDPFDAGETLGWIATDESLWQALSFLRVRPNKAGEVSDCGD